MKILISDDREEILEVLEEVLKTKNFEDIVKARDGKETIELYSKHKPDLVLLDILLPDMDGVEVTKEIKKLDSCAKIVAVTAFGREGLRDDCIKAGCEDFVFKPFKMKKLFEVIERMSKV